MKALLLCIGCGYSAEIEYYTDDGYREAFSAFIKEHAEESLLCGKGRESINVYGKGDSEEGFRRIKRDNVAEN